MQWVARGPFLLMWFWEHASLSTPVARATWGNGCWVSSVYKVTVAPARASKELRVQTEGVEEKDEVEP